MLVPVFDHLSSPCKGLWMMCQFSLIESMQGGGAHTWGFLPLTPEVDSPRISKVQIENSTNILYYIRMSLISFSKRNINW